jgi:hypothetical protein
MMNYDDILQTHFISFWIYWNVSINCDISYFKILKFLSINGMWFGKLYIGTFVAKNKVQAKYNEITSNFKILLGL